MCQKCKSAYCFKCKGEKDIVEPQYHKTSNNRNRISGKCAGCEGKLSKFISHGTTPVGPNPHLNPVAVAQQPSAP